MAAEETQELGREGVFLFKRWLESTTYLDLSWNSYGTPAMCEVQHLGGVKTFDLAGILLLKPNVPVVVECKRYTSPGAQWQEYEELLAIAYGAALHDAKNKRRCILGKHRPPPTKPRRRQKPEPRPPYGRAHQDDPRSRDPEIRRKAAGRRPHQQGNPPMHQTLPGPQGTQNAQRLRRHQHRLTDIEESGERLQKGPSIAGRRRAVPLRQTTGRRRCRRRSRLIVFCSPLACCTQDPAPSTVVIPGIE